MDEKGHYCISCGKDWDDCDCKEVSAVASNDRVINALSDKDRSQMFINLMCYIHRDGGQYMEEHGEQKAYKDAIKKILPLIQEHL